MRHNYSFWSPNDWQDVRNSADPIRLWARVLQSHIAVETGSSVDNRQQAELKYEALKQGANESLVSYKQRFDDALKALAAVDVSPHPDIK